MRKHYRIIQLMNEALEQRRCAFSTIRSENAALRRRALGDDAELLRPARGLYIPVSYWNGLTPEERTMHIARAFAAWHPAWIFGGNVAAAVHGLDGSWKIHDGTVTIVSTFQQSYSPMAKVRRTYIPEGMMKTQAVDGVTVLDKISTVLNCASQYEFPVALAVADSALRQGLACENVLEACRRWDTMYENVVPVVCHASAASENGGESYCRAVMIEEGFVVPELQAGFVDELTGARYRVDYLWRLSDGQIVVGEFDGTEKYVNPIMTEHRSIREVVQQERMREAALQRCGVTRIVRFSYDEVVERDALVKKLKEAGIPRYFAR